MKLSRSNKLFINKVQKNLFNRKVAKRGLVKIVKKEANQKICCKLIGEIFNILKTQIKNK